MRSSTRLSTKIIPIRQDDEVQVDCNLLLRASAQIQCALHPGPQGRKSTEICAPTCKSTSQAQKYIPSEEQCSFEDKCKHIQPQTQVQIATYGSRSAQASSLLKFIDYKNHSTFRGKFKASSIEVFYSSGGGLEGATNSPRLIPSAIRVAATMKVSMKDRKSCFLVLATLRDANLSSRASLQ